MQNHTTEAHAKINLRFVSATTKINAFTQCLFLKLWNITWYQIIVQYVTICPYQSLHTPYV
jgi:hypothetical protein